MRIISYIQSIPGSWWPQGGAINPQNGFWNVEVWLGFKRDAGKNLSIAVILVSEMITKFLRNMKQKQRSPGNMILYHILITQLIIMDKVTVTRI